MDAIVSAIAARVVFVEGTKVTFVNAEKPSDRISTTRERIPQLLADAYDAEVLRNTDEGTAFERLLEKWNVDRALRMLQIVIDDSEPNDIRFEAAQSLDSLIRTVAVRDRVENFALSIPLQSNTELGAISKLCGSLAHVVSLLRAIDTAQAHIATIRAAFEAVPSELFGSSAARNSFELAAIETGAAKGLVTATPDTFATAIFNCYRLLAAVPNSRQIVMEWTKGLGRMPKRKAFDQIDNERQTKVARETMSTSDRDPKETRHELYQNALKQQEGIKQRLKERDSIRAQRYAQDLVAVQMKKSGRRYAAMSLCALAQEAKRYGMDDLQLEWVRQAVEIAPNDAWAHGQAGDTYLDLWRLDEAREEYLSAIHTGEAMYGEIGLAKIFRASCRFDDALAAFRAAKIKYGTHPENSRAWSGHAEVLRDLSKFERALEVYDEAVLHYPEESSVHCGRAATLSDLGQLDAALDAYSEAIARFPDGAVPYGGRADVLKQMGRVGEALVAYADASQRFPNEVIPLCGTADVYKAMGKFDEALAVYGEAMAKFSHEPAAFCGFAETLKDEGRYGDALQAYDVAIDRFKYDVHARNGKANILKLMGRFEEALRAYDQNVRDFPYNLYALSGRADLLRLLGQPEQALEAYNAIIERRPDHPGAVPAKAAVLILLKRYLEAETLLPPIAPRTQTEWISLHVRGMLLLRRGESEHAQEIFQYGTANAPFFKQRKYFETAAAVCAMRVKSFEEADTILAAPVGDVARLLKVHVCFALNDFDRAREYLVAVNDNLPLPLAELRQEILKRYQLISEQPRVSEAWIEERETEVLLQAAA